MKKEDINLYSWEASGLATKKCSKPKQACNNMI